MKKLVYLGAIAVAIATAYAYIKTKTQRIVVDFKRLLFTLERVSAPIIRGTSFSIDIFLRVSNTTDTDFSFDTSNTSFFVEITTTNKRGDKTTLLRGSPPFTKVSLKKGENGIIKLPMAGSILDAVTATYGFITGGYKNMSMSITPSVSGVDLETITFDF